MSEVNDENVGDVRCRVFECMRELEEYCESVGGVTMSVGEIRRKVPEGY